MAPLHPRLSRSRFPGPLRGPLCGSWAGVWADVQRELCRSAAAPEQSPLHQWPVCPLATKSHRVPRLCLLTDPFREQMKRRGHIQKRLGILRSQSHNGKRGGGWQEQCSWLNTAARGSLGNGLRALRQPCWVGLYVPHPKRPEVPPFACRE